MFFVFPTSSSELHYITMIADVNQIFIIKIIYFLILFRKAHSIFFNNIRILHNSDTISSIVNVYRLKGYNGLLHYKTLWLTEVNEVDRVGTSFREQIFGSVSRKKKNEKKMLTNGKWFDSISSVKQNNNKQQ